MKLMNIQELKKYLEANNIKFEIRSYSNQCKTAKDASVEIKFPYKQMFKSLLCTDRNEYLLALLPSEKKLTLSKLGENFSLVPRETIEKITGYKLGTVSPFGLKSKVKVVLDKSALDYSKISTGSGSYGYELIVDVESLINFLSPEVKNITQK